MKLVNEAKKHLAGLGVVALVIGIKALAAVAKYNNLGRSRTYVDAYSYHL